MDAVADGRVVVEEKNVDFIRVGIGEVYVSEDLEGLRGNLCRIRGESMRDFEAVLVGLVFLMPADGIKKRIRKEEKD